MTALARQMQGRHAQQGQSQSVIKPYKFRDARYNRHSQVDPDACTARS